MHFRYIVNETGSPVEVLIPYNEFRLLEPLFSLLKDEKSEDSKSLASTDLTSFLEELKKQKKIKIPLLSQILQEIREDIR
jgi:hypothetical protein